MTEATLLILCVGGFVGLTLAILISLLVSDSRQLRH
jgi:hypothetical protein